jgi:hypothetical protein
MTSPTFQVRDARGVSMCTLGGELPADTVRVVVANSPIGSVTLRPTSTSPTLA